MIRVSFILGFILLAATSQSRAQTDPHFQIWTDFNPRVRLNEHFKIVGDIGYRIEPKTSAQTFLIRGALRYSPNRILSIDLGLAEFITWDTEILNSSEFRTYQFITVNWPNIGFFKIQHRFGLEQRWFRFNDLDVNEFIHRSRYRLGITSPDIFIFNIDIPFYVKGNVELLRDLNNDEISSLIDNNRFMLGIGGQVSSKVRTEIQFQVMAFNDPDVRKFIRNVDLIRIRAYYQFR